MANERGRRYIEKQKLKRLYYHNLAEGNYHEALKVLQTSYDCSIGIEEEAIKNTVDYYSEYLIEVLDTAEFDNLDDNIKKHFL